MRLVWLTIGCLALALAAAGAVLPLLPTTPFLLAAAYAFARSSPRLERWLVDHARFGPLIRDWRAAGAIARPAKRVALLAMAAAPVVAWLAAVPAWALALQVAILLPAAIFVATRPDPDPDSVPGSDLDLGAAPGEASD